MRIEQNRIDTWLVKGFDGVAGLVIQRSQSKAETKHVLMLEEAILNLDRAVSLAEAQSPRIEETDAQMFPLLLQLTKMLLARVRADESLEKANIVALQGYIGTLKMALTRFNEYELMPSSPEGLERNHEPQSLSNG
jgi:hypothetical protein